MACALPLLVATSAEAAFNAVLQGRSAGSPTWVNNNLRGWRELDQVPARVYMTGGPVSNRSLRIEIDHLTGGLPGIDSLSMFTPSANVVITSGPTLAVSQNGETWSYAFTFNLLNGNPGYIEFRARLASGALANPGSSLHLYGAPALGVLQFHRISAALSTDLVLGKTGPAVARPGEVITYTLSYSNKLSSSGPAGNVELTDVVPAVLSYVANSASSAPSISGNTLKWNLGILDRGSSGTITFRAMVSSAVTNNQLFENVAGIATDQTDVNPADNTARLQTRIVSNTAPSANDDSYSVLEDTTLTVSVPGVLANDTDPDGHALTAATVMQPQHGQLSFLSNGSFVYTPEANYFGPDEFGYVANDGLTNSNPARVIITVTPGNDRPVARPDAFELREDMPLSVAAPGVLANDADVDSATLLALVVSMPSHGSVTLNPNGAFTYVPEHNFFGSDSFTYRLSDGSLNSQPVTVALSVLPVNDAPAFVKGPNQVVTTNGGPETVANWATSISAGPANEASQTVHFEVSHDNNALFAVAPAIAADGTLMYVPRTGAHGLATVTAILKDNGGRASGGMDTSASQTFTIRVNAAPTAHLVIPTNGTIFLAPAQIPVVAAAEDIDGTIRKVQIVESMTNLIAEFLQMPYSVIWSNVGPGTYNLLARATDDLGATGVSEAATISVIDGPPVATGTLRFNPQTGLFEQPVRVFNPSSFEFSAVCVFVPGLPDRCRVWNASGTSNGMPFVQYNQSVPAGGSIDLLIEYYDPLRILPEPPPALYAEAVSPMEPIYPSGVELRVQRQRWLSDGTFLLEFNSALTRSYYVQYCDDMLHWKTAVPAVSGTGTRTQWIDNGPPRTESAPARSKTRLYRVVVSP